MLSSLSIGGGLACTTHMVLLLMIATCTGSSENFSRSTRRFNTTSNVDHTQEESLLSPPPPVTWELLWEDSFEGSVLNASRWNIKTNESHCCPAELELFVTEAVTVKDGKLVITTKQETVLGPKGKVYNFTSGWVDTKNHFYHKYGRFDANCSLPPRNATGIWPAFWLMPQNGTCWPTGGEIDIFEFNGDPLQDEVWGSYHWAKSGACDKDLEPIPGAPYRPHGSKSDWQLDFHVYTVEWSPERLDFYVDGNLYLTRMSEHVDLPTDPMYIIFDQAVDSWLFKPGSKTSYGKDGVTLQVEWVKVYTAKTQDMA
eukprot:m.99662 g.99662  ORF g.99662 m.99662 type:complete len:313 (-) comp27178_c0_seq3:787-1725(-)